MPLELTSKLTFLLLFFFMYLTFNGRLAWDLESRSRPSRLGNLNSYVYM